MGGMDEAKNVARVGELITQEVAAGWPTQMAAAKAVGVPLRSLANWMNGSHPPRRAAQEKLEAAFGWKRGAINEVLTAEDPAVYDIEALREDRPGRDVDLERVSDEALVVELGRRIGNLKAKLREYEEASAAVKTRDQYGLAASEGHLPDAAPED